MNNNVNIEAGATFSGPGALIVPDNSHLVADPNANINVLLDNEGAFRPGGINAVGRVDIKDYQQTDTGELFVETNGTLLNQYDRLVVNGVAALDGLLKIEIEGGFVPAIGNTPLNIISAINVVGTFETVDISGLPAGLTYYVNYTPSAVQLLVVNKPSYAADFDDDGDVDMTDYGIWRHAFQLNQLGDATGDNISDAADYVIWRKQLGLGPLPPGSGAALSNQVGVPEPATLTTALGLVILLCGIDFRRRST